MKTNFTILMMVFISLVGLAQKPQNSPELIHNNFQFRAGNPHEIFHSKKRGVIERTEWNDRMIKHIEFKRPSNLKAGQALPTQQMDSIIDYRWNDQTLLWEIFEKNWAEYDSLGNNTLNAWLGADGPTFPDYGGKWEAVWDASGRMAERTDFDWDFQTMAFIPFNKGIYTYDGNGNNTVVNFEQWDPSLQTWEPSIIDSFAFDAGGTFLESIVYSYDTLVFNYVPMHWIQNEFDSTGMRNRQNQYLWNIDVWDLISYTEFFQDEMGRDTSAIDYFYNGSWYEESQKRVTGFDAMGNIVLEADYIWDGESQFIGNSKYDYTLNAANNVTEEIFWNWDFFWWQWYIYDKKTYVHDGNGNLIEETRFSYDTASMAYTPDWKSINEFDLSSLMSDIALPLEIKQDIDGNPKLPIINKVLGSKELIYDTILLKWDTTEYSTFHYSPFGSMAPIACKASFNFTPDQDPLNIIFRDASGSDVSSWYWSFGDGTSSTQKNPQHKYAMPGTYKVSLSTIDASGECTNTNFRQIVIGNTACNAEFMLTTDTVGMMVTTVNTSQGSGLNYFWDFGDGEASKIMSPTHTYKYPGNYTINLTIQNALGTCMDRYSLSTRVGTGICQADFDVFVDSSTNTARFSAVNLNPDNLYRWEFGDGSYKSTRSPKVTKTFTHPGYYSATLKVSNTQVGCVNTKSGTILIGNKSPGGRAGFIYLSGNGNKVRFNDRSLGDDLKYYWNFGDQDTSTMQNPMHEFVLPGYYSVCLTVINSDGSRNTHCEKIFAGEDTKDECLARFEYKLSDDQKKIFCFDRSLGDPDKWTWTYDGRWPDIDDPNPDWTTSSPRYLKVQQIIRNTTSGCHDFAVAMVNMGAPGALKAGFGYVIDTSSTKAETYPVDFIGVSLGDAGKLKWRFGDGTFDSTTINPVHTYAAPGTYEVCLTVTNTTTGVESESCEMVKVGSPSSTNDLTVLENGLKSYPNPFSESTRIEINLIEETAIDLSVYDLMGRKIKTVVRDHRRSGTYIIDMNATDLDAGNYYLIMETSYGRARSVISVVK